MALSNHHIEAGPPANIDVLPIPPTEQIHAATSLLIKQHARELRAYQQAFSDPNNEHPDSFLKLQQMFGEFFPALDFARVIDFTESAKCSTLQFMDQIWDVRRAAHLKMARATVGIELRSSERGGAVREAIQGQLIDGARTGGIVQARAMIDKRLAEIADQEQFQHTYYGVKVADGVLAASQAEKSAAQYVNEAMKSLLKWRQ